MASKAHSEELTQARITSPLPGAIPEGRRRGNAALLSVTLLGTRSEHRTQSFPNLGSRAMVISSRNRGFRAEMVGIYAIVIVAGSSKVSAPRDVSVLENPESSINVDRSGLSSRSSDPDRGLAPTGSPTKTALNPILMVSGIRVLNPVQNPVRDIHPGESPD